MAKRKGTPSPDPPGIQIQQIPIGAIKPNSWNPNRMGDGEFAELVAEVKHLGRLPKPVIVRRDGDTWEIVDGEHGWRAAQASGLESVPCEVIEATDFEAMRQTYKRNRHGIHSKVLEGRMFRSMRDARKISNRELASELDMSEGTIRNAIAYAELADMVGAHIDSAFIDSMKVRDVRNAVLFGPAIASLWIKGGCNSVESISLHADTPQCDDLPLHMAVRCFKLEPLFEKHPLSEAIDMAKSAAASLSLYSTLPGAEAGMRSLIDRGESIEPFLEHFTYVNNYEAPFFNQDDWDAIVRRAVESENDTGKAIAFQVKAVKASERLGVVDQNNPYHFAAQKTLERAPDFIRDAELFTLIERAYLCDIYEKLQQSSNCRENAEQAMHKMVAVYQNRRQIKTGIAGTDLEGYGTLMPADIDSFVQELAACIDQQLVDRARQEKNAMFQDRERLTALVNERARVGHRIRCGLIGDRQACDVFLESVNALSMPQLVLLASFVNGEDYPFERWFNAVEAECVTVTQCDGQGMVGNAETGDADE